MGTRGVGIRVGRSVAEGTGSAVGVSVIAGSELVGVSTSVTSDGKLHEIITKHTTGMKMTLRFFITPHQIKHRASPRDGGSPTLSPTNKYQ